MNYKTIFNWVYLTGLLLLFSLVSQAAPLTDTIPPSKKSLNIILFTADDLDRNSLGCFGSKVPDITPNLDRFAKQSIRFQRAFVNAAICVPARAIIATGLYGNRSGVNGFIQMKEGSGIPLMLEILRSHDYAVGILGKVVHSTPKTDFKWDVQVDQQSLGWGRSPTLYYEQTKLFLDDCKKKNKPFYFMINSHDPHRPFYNPHETPEIVAQKTNQPLERISQLMKGMEPPSRIYSPEEITVPGFVPDLPGVREELSYYFNSTKRMDDTFGKVMKAVEESGYADNTIVIFIGDNGIALPFAKANVYYASNLTPLIIRWPGTIKNGSINREDIVSIIDFMPTILEALNIPAPKDIDGKSFLSLLKGQTQNGRDRAYMEIDYKNSGGPTPMRGIHTKQYSYIYNAWADGERVYANNNEGLTMKAMEEAEKSNPGVAERVKIFRLRVPEELYDIEKDPDSKNNLVNNPRYRKQLDALRKDLENWMIKTKDPLLKVFQYRNDPALALKELYSVYPEMQSLDKDKKTYSKARGGKPD